MAGRISGITIEIGGDTTKLQTALKGVDGQLKQTQTTLKDINKLLKLNPANTELLTQKQKNLEKAIQQTKDRLKQLKDAQKGVAQGSAEWDALQREIIDTETKLKSLEKEYRNFGSVGAQQIAAVGKKIGEVGKKLEKFGKDMTMRVTLPIVAFGAKAVSSFAEVDKTMQLTNKTMGNTEKEAKLLDSAMAQAAANSTFGMSDAANATLNFARAGLDAKQAAAALAPAMNLAAGEGGNLDTVSAGLVATINGFQDSFEQTSYYADIFAAACNNSALDVDSLSSSMSTAAPVFNAAGYTVKDAALYMGIMANNGIEASEAANSLKTGFAKLIDPAKEGAEWLEKLNFTITDENGNMKDTVTIQNELHESFSQLSEAQQIEAASAIFGKNQMSKWLALINTAPEDVGKLSTSLEKSKGTTEEMAKAMMGGFGGSIEKLKSTLDVLMTTLGKLAAEYLTPVLQKIQEWADKFNSLDENQKKTIITVLGVTAAIGPLLMIIGKICVGISMLTSLAPLLATAFSFLLSPIGLLIAGITAVIVVCKLLYNNWDAIKAWAITTWENIKNAVVTAVENIRNKIEEWITNTQEKMTQFGETIRMKIEELKSQIGEWIQTNLVQPALDKIAEFVNIGQRIVDNIKSGISGAWESLTSWFNGIWSSLFSNRSVDVTVNAQEGGGYATGLDYVPYNGFPAILHRGEAVLTAGEAQHWRDGGTGGIDYNRLAAAIAERPIVIQGDTAKIFKVVRGTNTVRTRATNYNALAMG